MTLDVKSLTGDDIKSVLPDLARLRMVVFRDWPYLYDGTLEYEEEYLGKFIKARGRRVRHRTRWRYNRRRLDRRADGRACR